MSFLTDLGVPLTIQASVSRSGTPETGCYGVVDWE